MRFLAIAENQILNFTKIIFIKKYKIYIYKKYSIQYFSETRLESETVYDSEKERDDTFRAILKELYKENKN